MAAEVTDLPNDAIRTPAATLSVLAWGLQFALFNPAIALVLSHQFGADDGQIGVALIAYNASGFVSTLLIPAAADKRGRYSAVVLLAGTLSLVLVLALAFAPSYAVAAIALLIIGGPASVSSSMLFAHLQSVGAPQGVVLRARAVLSFAWVAGPPLATAVVSIWGVQWLLAVIALDVIGGILATVWLRGQGTPRVLTPPKDTVRANNPKSALVSLFIAFVLLQATNYVVTSSLALYVGETLHLDLVWAGVSLGVAAALEVPVLMLISKWSDRVSHRWWLVGACIAGIGFYIAVASASNVPTLLLAQVLNSIFFSIVAGIGLTTFQEVIPRPGLASGLFTNVRRIGAMISGGIIALSPLFGGLRSVYAVCAGLVAVAAVLIFMGLKGESARRESRPYPANV